MPTFPAPARVRSKVHVRRFFDQLAVQYHDRHGTSKTHLAERLAILDRHAEFRCSDTVLDLGTGTGRYLRALSGCIGTGIGIDLSPEMVRLARTRSDEGKLSFRVDDAERLETVPSDSVDKVIGVGFFEHLLKPDRMLHAVRRVLRPGGCLVVLTLNGRWWWYRIADRLALPTRHLSTDIRPRPEEMVSILRRAGLQGTVEYWQFIPSGDLPIWIADLCRALERLGRRLDWPTLRSGLVVTGRRPPE